MSIRADSRCSWAAFAAAAIALVAGCAGPPSGPPADPLLPHDLFSLHSKLFEAEGEDRVIAVYRPDAYDADPVARFPVLYMPDGGVQEDFPHITNTIDALIAEGAIPPMLVVGIANTERRRDLTGPTRVAKDREIADVVGGSAAFRAFIRDELMPEIQKRYRCTEDTAIVGESLAGLFVVETFMLEPGMFDSYVAVSPSLWWNDHQLVRDSAAAMRAHAGRGTRLYLTSANETDIVKHVAALAAALTEHAPEDLDWSYVPRPDLEHHTIFRAVKAPAFRATLAR